ncbi:MAG TPA: ABC transporter ATP-binding protein, partial [Micromonospora sp.]
MPADPPRRVTLSALLPYLRSHRRTLLTVALLSLVGAGAALAQPLLTRAVLDAVGAARPVAGPVSLLVVLLVAGAVVEGLRDYLLQRTAEGLVLDTRRTLARHLLRLPVVEYDRRRTGDLLSRVGADTTLLRAVVTSGLFEAATGVVMVVGASVAMLLLDPFLFGVTLLGVGGGLTVAVLLARRVRGLSEQAQARVGEMTSAVERAITAARTIRASRAEEREAAAVGDSARQAYDAGLRVARLGAYVGPAGTIAVQGAFLLVLAVGGGRVASGVISVGDLVAFVMFLFFLVVPLGRALHAYTQLQQGLGALQRIEEMLVLPVEGADDRVPPAPVRAGVTVSARRPPSAPANRVAAVEFDRVGFRYADGAPVLREVSFTVPRGTRTALVGPSGAGKSSLLALVERFYEVTEGAIRIDGTDIRELPRAALRARLGYVEQEAPVLAGSLRDNLLLAAPGVTDERLLAVLAEVNLAALVERTPAGLDAEVGEGGVL